MCAHSKSMVQERSEEAEEGTKKKRRRRNTTGEAAVSRRTSKYFRTEGPPTPAQKKEKTKKRSRREVYEENRGRWIPPASSYGLLEEQLYEDPWKLLVACMLLNKTSINQVRSVIWKLFDLIPNAQAAVEADETEIEAIIQPLGLFRKRSKAIKRFSQEYLEKDWESPDELHGIGTYAADAYAIFCIPDAWRKLEPEDKELKLYVKFLKDTDGLGSGFSREPIPQKAETNIDHKSSLTKRREEFE